MGLFFVGDEACGDEALGAEKLRREDHIHVRHDSVFSNWAMSTKAQAERTEARLLKVFDYAWNRGGNGARRPRDVLLKLEKLSSQKLTHEWNMTLRNIREKKWILFGKKAAGIMIDGKKPTKAKQSNQGGATLRNNFGPFSLTRNRIRLVSMKGSMEKTTLNADENTCNVALGDGSICVATPVKGRKRSPDHKGQKGINVKNHIEASNVSTAAVLRHQAVKEHTDEKRHCGVPLDDGSLCKILPDKGRKRCNIHKGMRAPIRTI